MQAAVQSRLSMIEVDLEGYYELCSRDERLGEQLGHDHCLRKRFAQALKDIALRLMTEGTWYEPADAYVELSHLLQQLAKEIERLRQLRKEIEPEEDW